MFVLAIYKTSHARYYDNVDWRHVQYPDKQCGYYWYPDSVTVYLGGFCHGESGSCNKGYYRRANSLEYILYNWVLFELLKEQGNCQYDKEGSIVPKAIANAPRNLRNLYPINMAIFTANIPGTD